MRCIRTELPEVLIIEPDVHRDSRGAFLETYHAMKYRELGIVAPFVQDNHSFSVAGTLRGLHIQWPRPQGKLISVIDGTIFDVAVDVRRGSSTFGRSVVTTLSGENCRQCYVPPGFAHGFCVLSESAQVSYKCTEFYEPSAEFGILWNDPDLAIAWPIESPLMSPKDRANARLRDTLDRLPAIDAISTLAEMPR